MTVPNPPTIFDIFDPLDYIIMQTNHFFKVSWTSKTTYPEGGYLKLTFRNGVAIQRYDTIQDTKTIYCHTHSSLLAPSMTDPIQGIDNRGVMCEKLSDDSMKIYNY